MLEPEYYWVRYKGNAIGRMYIHDMYAGWQPALYDATNRDVILFGYDEPLPADLFEITRSFIVHSSLSGNHELYDMQSVNHSALQRSFLATPTGLNRVVVEPSNWLRWLCKLISHRWRNIYWNNAATVWRVRCSLCKKTEERSWK